MSMLIVRDFSLACYPALKNATDDVILAKLTAIATKEGAIKTMEENPDNSLGHSYASEVIGDNNIAILEVSKLTSCKASKGASWAMKNAIAKARREALANLLFRGIVDADNQVWKPITSTPSGKKQGKVIMVREECVGKLEANLGLTEDMTDGLTYVKTLDKLFPNCFSGQYKGVIAQCGWGMKNVLILKSRTKGTFWKHSVKARNIQNLTLNGDVVGKLHDGELTNKVGDANGIVIREHMPAGVETKWCEQSRGKGLKATLTDAPVLKWCAELGITEIEDFWGNTHKVSELDAEGYHILVTEDAMKASALWSASPEAWKKWCEHGYDVIWCCANGHVSSSKKEGHKSVITSRQHTTPLIGATKEDMANVVSRSKEEMLDVVANGSHETKLLCKLWGADMQKSTLAKAFDTEKLINERNRAEYGKVSVSGTWAMTIWDLKPLLAVAAKLDDESKREDLIARARTMKGNTIALNNWANIKLCAFGRYPSLNKNLIFVRIIRNDDLCDNVLVLSWDILWNDACKGDCDGDHACLYFPESEEELNDLYPLFLSGALNLNV